MAFEPGHPYHPPAHEDRGKHAPRRAAQKHLAAMIREAVPPEQIIEWLVSVWQGRDPLTGNATSMEERERALRLLLERGWGTAPQHLVLDAQVAALVATVEVDPTLDKIPTMTDDQLRALAALGVGLLPAGSGEGEEP
jgi:hypothetical protein